MTKDRARVDEWCKQVAPSTELRTWYAHDPQRFEEFSRRYRAELAEPAALHQSSLSVLIRGRDGLWINVESRTVHLPALIVRKSEASGQVSSLVLRMTGSAGGSGSLRTPLRASPEPSMKILENPRKSMRFAAYPRDNRHLKC